MMQMHEILNQGNDWPPSHSSNIPTQYLHNNYGIGGYEFPYVAQEKVHSTDALVTSCPLTTIDNCDFSCFCLKGVSISG